MRVDEQSEPEHFFFDAGELRMSHWSNPSPRHPKERSEVSTAIDAGHLGGNCCTDTPSKILLYTCNLCVAVTLPPTRIHHFPGYRTLNLSPLRHCRHSAVPYSHLRSTIAVTNKLRNVQANPTVPPRPPRLRLPPNHRIASAPASTLFDSTRILAAGALAETVLSTGHPVGVVI